MPLASQLARKNRRPEIRETAPAVERDVRVENVELVRRDPRSGLFLGRSQDGGVHSLNSLGVGSGLGRVQAAIVSKGVGVISI